MTNNDTLSKMDTIDEQINAEETHNSLLKNCAGEPSNQQETEPQKKITQSTGIAAGEDEASLSPEQE